jgi:glucose-6-phosphate 1-dehydrogenase
MTETLLVLGASGDLASRLLLPALGQLLTVQPRRTLHLVGAGMEDLSADDWHTRVKTSFDAGNPSGEAVDQLLSRTSYHQADVTSGSELASLLEACEGTPTIYFALPPSITAQVCDALADIALPDGTQLALEKPFGVDEGGAVELNARLARLVPESQIHRVDHFLGRSTVLNLLGLRFANRVFEPVWNNQHVERVDIVYDEQLALEGRARYYDGAGALVDMIQSHLLQVMAVLAMEPPATLEAKDLRDAKGICLRATHAGDPATSSRRARYGAGSIDGRELPAYVDEDGVDPDRGTETLAEMTVEIRNWRWAGVPFTLRSGKALGERRREVVITFRPAAQVPVGLRGVADPDRLRIALAPDQVELELNINGPDDPYVIDRATMSASFGPGELEAYGEVLEGMLDGDPSLSVRGDTAEQCWRIVAPVLEAWRVGTVPLEDYPAGSCEPLAWAPLG